jgi:uncharacterized protein YjbI with pentapeptide repeats
MSETANAITSFWNANLTGADLTLAILRETAFNCASLQTTTLESNSSQIRIHEFINGSRVEVSRCR